MVKIERRFEPDAARASILTEKYDSYCATIETNVQAWSNANAAKVARAGEQQASAA
jgi:hypothetical protein